MRMATILSNVEHVLSLLEKEKSVKKIFYPGRYENSDQKNLFESDYCHGGGLITIEFYEDVDLKKNIEKLQSIKMAPSFGSIDTLVEIPMYMSYWPILENKSCPENITESLVRLSVGCEPIEFIISDIKRICSC